MVKQKIAIYGAGSLGTIIGAFLASAFDDVTLIDSWPEHVKALNQLGAHVVGTTDKTVPVHAVTPDAITEQFDVILLLTKQVYNDTVIPEIKQILAPNGTVVSLQNGVPEEKLRKSFDDNQIIAGSVEFGATFISPGISKLTTDYSAFKKNAFQIGQLDGAITKRVTSIQKILSHVGGTTVSDNLLGTKWSKLLVNAAFSGLSAAWNTTYGGVMDTEVGIFSALHIISEGLKAGQVSGVTFAKMGGKLDLTQFAEPTSDNEAIHPAYGNFTEGQVKTLRVVMAPSAKLEASMLQDLKKHRQTEIQAINGVIADAANQHHQEAPVNALVIQIVEQAQRQDQLPETKAAEKQFEQLLLKKGGHNE